MVVRVEQSRQQRAAAAIDGGRVGGRGLSEGDERLAEDSGGGGRREPSGGGGGELSGGGVEAPRVGQPQRPLDRVGEPLGERPQRAAGQLGRQRRQLGEVAGVLLFRQHEAGRDRGDQPILSRQQERR